VWDFLRKRPEHPFRDSKFTFFIFILIPVQTLFAHQWLTIPYYIDRAFAGTAVGNNFEFFSNINPILIFFLCPMVAVLTSRANVYRMMIIGTLVMALPTFFLAVGTTPFLLMSYIVLMTIGEAMWQPRFLQFAAQIAPKGKTGVYMGVAQFPWFLTKVVTGLYSGWFLSRYCPNPELGLAMKPHTMWFIYGLIALASPIALILTKRWIGKDMHERAMAGAAACAKTCEETGC
jgi:MFS family permease